ncbi:MAG: PqqD family protein [Lachnospiraceae bacterium]
MKKVYKKPFVQIKKSDESSGNEASKIFKVSENMLLREIAGETLLIPVGEMAIKIHGMISLSESGVLLWKKLKDGCTEETLVDAILGEYEIDRETACSDVRAFLEKLRNIGILIQDGEE